LEGVDEIMEDPNVTSVRLVTNPEKMVLRETERAFVYFSLHGMTVDAVIVNRLLPNEVSDAWFREWENDFECFANTGVNTPETMWQSWRIWKHSYPY
jgi:anion-transporting  ArsA/GET3 family ATPase